VDIVGACELNLLGVVERFPVGLSGHLIFVCLERYEGSCVRIE